MLTKSFCNAGGKTGKGANHTLFCGGKPRVAGVKKGCGWFFRAPLLCYFLLEKQKKVKKIGSEATQSRVRGKERQRVEGSFETILIHLHLTLLQTMIEDSLKRLTAEERLLLSLCRIDFNSEQKKEVQKHAGEIRDWDSFVRMANEHGIIALSWFNLIETGCRKIVPAGYLDKMHSAYLGSLARNTLLSERCGQVLSLARQKGIKVILLKGMALEKSIYGNKGVRQMSDIDILVSREDAVPLRNILLKNGFVSVPLISPLHERIMPSYGKHLPEMCYNGTTVEIHFKLFDQKGNRLSEDMIRQAVTTGEDNNEVYIAAPRLCFLYLVRHLDRHEAGGTSQLRLYADLAVLLSAYRNEILNLRLFEEAQSVNLAAALSAKLHILNTFWGFSLPQWTGSLPRSGSALNINNTFVQFLRNPKSNLPETEPESLLKPLKEIPGIFDRLLFITGYIFPSLTFMKFRYKTTTRKKALLYYPVRLLKLVKIMTGFS